MKQVYKHQTFCQIVILILFGVSTIVDICKTLEPDDLTDRLTNFLVRLVVGVTTFALAYGAGAFSEIF
jgi:hypothetical protein